MAKTTYTGANVAPTTDTFSEWVDLTNRITYDMSDVVITVADVSQPSGTNHAETTGNGHVNGYFSSNYLIANTELRGGTTSASANLISFLPQSERLMSFTLKFSFTELVIFSIFWQM